MNHAEQRILLRRIEIGRLDQDAFDRRAVLALPGDDLARGERPVLDLIRHRGQLARCERAQGRHEDLVQRSRRRRGEGHRAAVFRERDAAQDQVVRLADSRDGAGGRIDSEQVRRRSSAPREVDAVGVPLHEVRLLVEAVRDRFRRSAGAGNYGQPRVRVEELRIAHCRREDDLISHPATSCGLLSGPRCETTFVIDLSASVRR